MKKPVSWPIKDDRPLQKDAVLHISLPPVTAFEQIAKCKSCTSISDYSSRTPVQCVKFAGSSVPISVNLTACHTCGDYKLN